MQISKESYQREFLGDFQIVVIGFWRFRGNLGNHSSFLVVLWVIVCVALPGEFGASATGLGLAFKAHDGNSNESVYWIKRKGCAEVWELRYLMNLAELSILQIDSYPRITFLESMVICALLVTPDNNGAG